MRYAQVKGGQKLHLVYELGDGLDPRGLPPVGHLSRPLCNRPMVGGYRMNINVSLANGCKNCYRVYAAQQRKDNEQR